MKSVKRLKQAAIVLSIWSSIAAFVAAAVLFPVTAKAFVIGAALTMALILSWRLAGTYIND